MTLPILSCFLLFRPARGYGRAPVPVNGVLGEFSLHWGMADPQSSADDGISFTDQPLHAAFETQLREMLEQADLTEEQKQQVLVAMQCPCCGSGGLSLSIKLKD
jgi:hypothetical protein